MRDLCVRCGRSIRSRSNFVDIAFVIAYHMLSSLYFCLRIVCAHTYFLYGLGPWLDLLIYSGCT